MTVGRQLNVGFGAVIAATVVTGIVSVLALQATIAEKDELARDYAEDLARVENLRYRAEQIVATTRGLLLVREDTPDAELSSANEAFQSSLLRVTATSEREKGHLDAVAHAW